MKIKSNLYCITDKNNKPDFRYLFEDPQDAQKKIRLIKNSTRGETLFITKEKRDFFIDGVKRKFINPERKIAIKRGCWTKLKVTKLLFLDNIDPRKYFHRFIQSENHQFSYDKLNQPKELSFKDRSLNLPIIPNPLLGFDWETSFLRTKTFVGTFALLCLVTLISVFTINQKVNNQIAQQMIDIQNDSNQKIVATQTKVLGAKDDQVASSFDENLNKFVLDTLKNFTNLKQEEFQQKLAELLSGSPMEKMTPYISQQDKTVAAFLVGIAKKESDFGRHVPVLNGQDCYNYWGYRGIRDRMGTGGHTCFDSPEDAVNTVAGRLKNLVQSDVNTPKEMVIWKCGSACNQDAQAGKWISDVTLYFNKVNDNDKDKDDKKDDDTISNIPNPAS